MVEAEVFAGGEVLHVHGEPLLVVALLFVQLGQVLVERPVGGERYGAFEQTCGIGEAAFGAVRVLIFTSLFATAAIAGISWLELDRMALLFMVGAAGAGLIAGTTGQSGLAVSLYQPGSRATGVGFSAALGRIGSIVGPAVGGALLSFGAPTRTIILIACIPLIAATLAMTVLAIVGVRPKAEQL